MAFQCGFGHWEAFCLSISVQILPLDVTTAYDSYAWNYRELWMLLIACRSSAGSGFEQLTKASMDQNLTTEIS